MYADDVAEEVAAGRELAVVVIEEEDVFDAEEGGGVALLLAAHLDQVAGRDGFVVAALGAVGADQVVELPALLRPEVGGAGGAEVGVVRVSGDDEGAARTVRGAVWRGRGQAFEVGCHGLMLGSGGALDNETAGVVRSESLAKANFRGPPADP